MRLRPVLLAIAILLLIVLVAAFYGFLGSGGGGSDADGDHANLIRVTTPSRDALVASPLTVRGEARGTWFFEATFPVTLLAEDGRVLAETYATAESDWMTEEFVPFSVVVTFSDPGGARRGTLVLKKDNPSGLPEYDDELRLPVRFR